VRAEAVTNIGWLDLNLSQAGRELTFGAGRSLAIPGERRRLFSLCSCISSA
jgi:hypothetical protein